MLVHLYWRNISVDQTALLCSALLRCSALLFASWSRCTLGGVVVTRAQSVEGCMATHHGLTRGDSTFAKLISCLFASSSTLALRNRFKSAATAAKGMGETLEST